MRIRSGTLLTFLAVVASASADPLSCQTGTVADYQNTSCTIGNLTFTFGSANTFDFSGLLGLTPSYFTMTPDDTNPNAPGFILSGAVTEASSDIQGGGGLDWTFQLQSLGGPLITGLRATVTGTSTGLSFNTIYALFDACDANNSLDCAAADPGSPFEQTCAGPSCTAHSDFPSPVASTDLATSLLRYSAIGGGSPGFSSTITSASYYVVEAAPVPEPSSVVFLGAALFGIAAGGILKHRKAHCVRLSSVVHF